MSEPRWLDQQEMATWLPYVKNAARVLAVLDRDLRRRHGISGSDYEVLHHLSEAPAEHLRIGDLAQLVADSNSRMSHRIDRLAGRGLVARHATADDGRGRVIQLTAEGRQVLERAAPEHVALVRRLFVDALTPDELVALAGPLARLSRHLDALPDAADDVPC